MLQVHHQKDNKDVLTEESSDSSACVIGARSVCTSDCVIAGPADELTDWPLSLFSFLSFITRMLRR